MTAEEAKKHLIQGMESQARLDAAGIAKRTLEEARENAEREAREIITTSIQRVVRDYVSESTISVVPIPNDAMKGRIIGREGRNIRAIEAATGIDLIIDETPEAVIISGFDPLRREIAKVSLERLMHDGRIHPTRIEEIVEKVKVDIDKLMYEEAEKIIFELGLSDFHPELIKVLGRLKYRTSYGQNNLYHAREASYICGIMASELGLDVRLARRGALLHDIGKAVSHEEEGKAHRYAPLVARDRAGKTALGQVLGKIFGGSREMLLANLVKEKGIDTAELRRLKKILDARLGSKAGEDR